jgi:hypothetical protein
MGGREGRGVAEGGGQAKYVICCKLGEFLLLLQEPRGAYYMIRSYYSNAFSLKFSKL